MKNLFLFIIFLASCTPYSQVFNTASIDGKTKVEKYFPVFENDTLKVVYDFWDNKGKMSFAIFNKYSKPIYIDWKKCSFIYNGGKNDYYQEQITTTSVSEGVAYKTIFNVAVGASATSEHSIRSERVVFIPPGSGIRINTGNTYRIVSTPAGVIGGKKVKKDMKSAKGYEYKVSKEEARIVFRNFITYSTTENFAQEQYVDNGFYVNSITTMKVNKFLVSTEHLNGNTTTNLPYQEPDRFYYAPMKRNEIANP